MSEYVFRYAPGYGCDMNELMDGGRVTVGDYFASESTDHYGTLHEEIVRCSDCRYNARDTDGLCYRFDHEHFNYPDGFCAWASRRDE